MYFYFNIQQERQNTYKHNFKARSRNHFRRGKAINITYFGRVSVALFIQRAKRLSHVILSSVACLTVPCFSVLSRAERAFRRNVCQHKMRLLFSLQPLQRQPATKKVCKTRGCNYSF